MEDVIEKDPMAAYPPDQDHIGFQTDDPLINAWERELAKGGTPDIGAAFQNDPAIAAWLNPKKAGGSGGEGGQPPVQPRAPQPTKPVAKTGVPIEPPNFEDAELEFHDDFTGGFDGKPG